MAVDVDMDIHADIVCPWCSIGIQRLETFARVQPISVIVDAVRALTLGGDTMRVWQALLWILGVLLVFIPLSVRQYRRTA